jgi:hypothetical protein
MHKGSCLCGAVSFEVEGELKPGDACHCDQCRKQSGHFWASTNVSRDAIAIDGEDKVSWYRSSGRVRRGFCSQCGSVLFWELADKDLLAVAMGAFDKPTGAELEMHIFVGSKGDYYEIADGLPQYERFPPAPGA